MQLKTVQTNTAFNILWLRRNLRWEDNRPLAEAINTGLPILPIFIYDTSILDELDSKDDARVQFIHERLDAMDKEIKSQDGKIWRFHGMPADIFTNIFKTWNVKGVYHAKDFEPSSKKRDEAIKQIADKYKVPIYTCLDHIIFEPGSITTNEGAPYRVYTPFSKQWISSLTDELTAETDYSAKNIPWVKHDQKTMTLEDIGFKPSHISVPDYNLEDDMIKRYEGRRNFPAQNGTSGLSTHLRFGTVSVRNIVNKAKLFKDLTFLKEMIWREFFIHILDAYPNSATSAFKPKYRNLPWKFDEIKYSHWCRGMTGIPIVDAGMRELNTTGLMHNRVRMITASWLTKNMLHDWRLGERYFAKKLLDYELASNVGNWQWVAGTGCDAAPYFRIFNPYTQADKFDPNKNYINKWVPEWEDKTKYPDPVVDYNNSRNECLEFYKTHAN